MVLEDQVYIATYCHTDVFESVINGIPLMRRCSDDWINATQILRIANFPKNKRTKILEKQVQIHTHEKVQGGYGRFQGTWIPLPLARDLALKYEIDAKVAPLLFSESKELVATPFKRKGKPGRNLGVDNEINPSPTKIPKSDKKKVAKAPKKEKGKGVKSLKFQEQEARLSQDMFSHYQQQQQPQQANPQANGTAPPPPPQFMPVFQQLPYQQYNFPNQAAFYPQTNIYNIPQFQQQQQQHPIAAAQVSFAQQQHQPSNSQDSVTSNIFSTNDDRRNSDGSVFSSHSVTLISPPVITSSQQQQQNHHSADGPPPQPPVFLEEDENSIYTAQLLDYFERDNAEIPKFLYDPPSNFRVNDPIDDEGHTALHWAASLANLPILEVLMNIHNANPTISNNSGMNCLSKMVQFNNSYELQNFPQILELFKICLVTPDFNARIPLHYLMELLGKGDERNSKSLKYYLDVIIGFAEMLPSQNGRSLLKILLNHQDINGDTTLHICCSKTKRKDVLKLLLTKGADINVCNNAGVSCRDMISIEVLEEFQSDAAQNSRPRSAGNDSTSTVPQIAQRKKNDAIDNKENIFIENQQNSSSFKLEIDATEDEADEEEDEEAGIESSTQQLAVEHKAEESQPSRVVDSTPIKGKALTSFQERVPDLLNSLNESFCDQMNEKDEEYRHNLSIYQHLTENVKDVTRQVDAKLAVDNRNGAGNHKSSSLIIQDTVTDLEMELFKKQKRYLQILEKSQSLQLAKLVQQAENDGDDEDQQEKADDVDTILRLSLRQFKRKQLISELILKICKFDTAKPNFSNYKKLISKACGLDDINDELLDDIEEALIVK